MNFDANENLKLAMERAGKRTEAYTMKYVSERIMCFYSEKRYNLEDLNYQVNDWRHYAHAVSICDPERARRKK